MQIITLPAFRAVGMRIRTTSFSNDIPALWQRFMPFMESITTSTPGVSYGLMGDHHADGTFAYMAALAVTNDTVVDSALDTWHVPAQRYAVFATQMSHLGETFGRIHGEWVPASGHAYGVGPSFEYYGPEFDTPAHTLHIYIAIQ
ncbi:MAG: GyrI-like domain-containing protein [Chloroflexi bacterium]|nr:GyrI-like domain-containing protein [Chloroflexota bacterium]